LRALHCFPTRRSSDLAYKNGVHGDTNATFLAGDVSEEHRLLVERTKEAMMLGIKVAKPGREINVIGRVIESYANRFGYNVVRDLDRKSTRLNSSHVSI